MNEKERPTLKKYDAIEKWRCPQLGGPVTFEYCRRMHVGLPCNQLFNCWNGQIDVQAYLDENFTQEELNSVFEKPSPGRVGTMVDVLKKVLEEKKSKES